MTYLRVTLLKGRESCCTYTPTPIHSEVLTLFQPAVQRVEKPSRPLIKPSDKKILAVRNQLEHTEIIRRRDREQLRVPEPQENLTACLWGRVA